MNRIGIMKKKYLICIYESYTLFGISLAILLRWVPQYDLGTHSVARDYYQTVYHICCITNILLPSSIEWHERERKTKYGGREPYTTDKIGKKLNFKR